MISEKYLKLVSTNIGKAGELRVRSERYKNAWHLLT